MSARRNPQRVCNPAVTIVAAAPPLFPKNLDKPKTEVRFRPSQVGLRRAETALRNFETPLLSDPVWEPMEISGLHNRRNFTEKFLHTVLLPGAAFAPKGATLSFPFTALLRVTRPCPRRMADCDGSKKKTGVALRFHETPLLKLLYRVITLRRQTGGPRPAA